MEERKKKKKLNQAECNVATWNGYLCLHSQQDSLTGINMKIVIVPWQNYGQGIVFQKMQPKLNMIWQHGTDICNYRLPSHDSLSNNEAIIPSDSILSSA
jgi:hypothetical protein